MTSDDATHGYLLAHFREEPSGYAEKVYFDISTGGTPWEWEPLNGGRPVLASNVGTTGARDIHLTRNPQTGVYYVVCTDLRVFDPDRSDPPGDRWKEWSHHGSTRLLVWRSTDLIEWSGPELLDVAVSPGTPPLNLGMAWAPETTWVPDFDGAGSGAFVLYWSSTMFDPEDSERNGASYSRVLWGSTTDFTAATYRYGGVLIDTGAEAIDTTIVQNDGTTYRITKDNGHGAGLYMESTRSPTWWLPDTRWALVQERIGACWAGGNPGGVEGPTVFQSPDRSHWFLLVDVIPATGYRPMVTSDLDRGWSSYDAPFGLATGTKHGGVLPLTASEYARLRAADSEGAL